jgi:hypothetical protein
MLLIIFIIQEILLEADCDAETLSVFYQAQISASMD